MGSTGRASGTTRELTINTSNGTYEITPMGNGYTVQLQGDEEFFNTYEDARNAVQINVLWSNAPLKDKQGLYTNNDLQRMIEFINNNQVIRDDFIKRLPKNADGRAIEDVLDDGYYERFDRYDSDVAEQFIDMYRNFR